MRYGIPFSSFSFQGGARLPMERNTFDCDGYWVIEGVSLPWATPFIGLASIFKSQSIQYANQY
jgi:hypothetical protein